MLPRRRGDAQLAQMSHCFGPQAGFSLVELFVVVLIALVLASFAISSLVSSIRAAHLRGAASDLSGLYEQARMYAIRDNRYYATHILSGSGTAPEQAYVDMFPKGVTGASGNGGASVAAGDPLIAITSEVVQQPVVNAPNVANLQSQLPL